MLFFSSEQKDSGRKCAELLREEGSVLIVPTETVYGLVCGWTDEAARRRIYELKHRSPTKLFAAFVPDLSSAEDLCGRKLPISARILAERFMPGAITLVVPDVEGRTFGFRIPDHPFISDLLSHYRGVLASTSANLSGEPAALDLQMALKSIDGVPAGVVDGGVLPSDSLASTVVHVTEDSQVKILREGGIPSRKILAALGN